MVWDVNVPAATDRIRNGDDAIREFKVDVQTALLANAADGTEAKFPGPDTANPVFRYRGLRGSNAAKPAAGNYGLYANTDSGNLERDRGTVWDVVASILPVGVVLPYAGAAVAPAGFLLCDGSAISRTTYAALFAAIGTAHGTGDGSTTFNLPDLRGRFVRFTDNGIGRDPDRASRTAGATGGNTGDNVGTVQGEQLKSHTHTVTDPGHTHVVPGHDNDGSGGTRYAGALSGQPPGGVQAAANSNTTGLTNQSTGGNETRPINIGLNAIIKY